MINKRIHNLINLGVIRNEFSAIHQKCKDLYGDKYKYVTYDGIIAVAELYDLKLRELPKEFKGRQ